MEQDEIRCGNVNLEFLTSVALDRIPVIMIDKDSDIQMIGISIPLLKRKSD